MTAGHKGGFMKTRNRFTLTSRTKIMGTCMKIMLIGLFCLGLLYLTGPEPAAAQQTTVNIMPLGNSITQAENRNTNNYNSYRRPLWHLLNNKGYDFDFVGSLNTTFNGNPHPDPDFDLDHEGHWGWRADQIVNGCTDTNCQSGSGTGMLSEWLEDYTPDIVLLHIGHNDLQLGGDTQVIIQQTLDNVGDIIAILRTDNPNVIILLAQLIPSTRSPRNTRIPLYNAELTDWAAANTLPESPIVIVDQFTGFNAPSGQDTYDGTHPNVSGEQKMAERWFEALRPFLPFVWEGTQGNDWHNPFNWKNGVVPGEGDYVLITNGTISLSQDTTVAGLTLEADATLNLNEHSLTVTDRFENKGTLQQMLLVDSPVEPVAFLHITNDDESVTHYRGADIETTADLGLVTVSIRQIDPDDGQACTSEPTSPAYANRCYTITPATNGPATITLWAQRKMTSASWMKQELTIYRYVATYLGSTGQPFDR
jgi:lysophospholipase L1-like esterase